MKEFLFFRLYGIMASWGDIAVGEVRPSFSYPTKSAIMGMIAAALGIERNENEKHTLLNRQIGFSVFLNNPGILLQDYHTIQVPPANRGPFYTRKQELSDKKQLNTILSNREYRCDSISTVGIWMIKENSGYSLHEIKDALLFPHFVLYLGRKSCPVSLPLAPVIVKADSLKDAYLNVNFKDDEFVDGLKKSIATIAVYYDALDNAGFSESIGIKRRDNIFNRQNWQFYNRAENLSYLTTGG